MPVWSLSAAAYDTVSLDMTAQTGSDTVGGGIFSSDGTKFYGIDATDSITSGGTAPKIFQYTCGTPYVLSSGSYASKSLYLGASIAADNVYAFAFKSDGSKFYAAGYLGGIVYQWSLSTPWDISTGTYDSVSFNATAQVTNPGGIDFKTDGTKMYLADLITGKVFQYSLTAWDLSTASYASLSFDTSTQVSAFNLKQVAFKTDGSKMYVTDGGSVVAYQYTLGTPWNVSTASYDTVSYTASSQIGLWTGAITFKPDGTKMYGTDYFGVAYQYTLGTAGSFKRPPLLNGIGSGGFPYTNPVG